MAPQTYPAFYPLASGKSDRHSPAGRPLPANGDGVSGEGGGKTAWRVGGWERPFQLRLWQSQSAVPDFPILSFRRVREATSNS